MFEAVLKPFSRFNINGMPAISCTTRVTKSNDINRTQASSIQKNDLIVPLLLGHFLRPSRLLEVQLSNVRVP